MTEDEWVAEQSRQAVVDGLRRVLAIPWQEAIDETMANLRETERAVNRECWALLHPWRAWWRRRRGRPYSEAR